MNYIQILKNDIDDKNIRLMNYAALLLDLEIYLQSSKFHDVNLVNVNDILLRIKEFKIRIYN